MKNKYHDVIRERLKQQKDECKACLYPPDGSGEWGCTSKKYLTNTINLMNYLLKDIPEEAWPKDKDRTLPCDGYRIKSGAWRLSLFWSSKNKRGADLKYSHDDHTAWVKERGGKFIDSDIGGS